jgi:hypothetical protein
VAQRISDRETGYVHRLASSCLPPILALEVATTREAAKIGRDQMLAPPNGIRESNLGGEERIADELWLKLQIRLSPRTVGKYIARPSRPRGSQDQRWSTFLQNHAREIVACDFFVSVTAGFRILYIFVALEIGSRRLVDFNVTEHPTSESTLQQLREALPGDQDYKFLLHDRHKTSSVGLDEQIESWGIQILRLPVRTPARRVAKILSAAFRCLPTSKWADGRTCSV